MVRRPLHASVYQLINLILNRKVKDVKVIYSRNPNYNYVFPFQKWLDGQNKYSSVIQCEETQQIAADEAGKLIYFLTVFTGNVKNAGTNANVFVEIGGSLGKTASIKLESKKKPFERGQKDHFNVSCAFC